MLHLTTTTWRGHGLLVVWRANLGWPVFGWGSAYCRFALHNYLPLCVWWMRAPGRRAPYKEKNNHIGVKRQKELDTLRQAAPTQPIVKRLAWTPHIMENEM